MKMMIVIKGLFKKKNIDFDKDDGNDYDNN